MAATHNVDWSQLPDLILVHILSYLPFLERCQVSSVCKNWHMCLKTPQLWKFFHCSFFLASHGQVIKIIQQYGKFVTHLSISLNQNLEENRANALAVLDHFCHLETMSLISLQIQFKGENPLFYAGHEFIVILARLFEKFGSLKENLHFKHLNLNSMQVAIDENIIMCIATNCPKLESLNILNNLLVCNVSPLCVKKLVENCRSLKVLHLYHTSLSDDVFGAMTQVDRTPLKRLGIVCRRAEKYGEDLSSEAWSKLLGTNKDLKVELGFDHTCPLHRVQEILKPEIPVQDLHLATFTRIHHELNLVSNFYGETLEKLVVQTRPSRDLEEALLSVAQSCSKLHTLYVYCVLRKDVIEQILSLRPLMKDRGSYILKWEMDPEPWTVGKEEGD